MNAEKVALQEEYENDLITLGVYQERLRLIETGIAQVLINSGYNSAEEMLQALENAEADYKVSLEEIEQLKKDKADLEEQLGIEKAKTEKYVGGIIVVILIGALVKRRLS